MKMTEFLAYDEFVNFIAAGPSSQLVAAFQPSEMTRQRVASLVARKDDRPYRGRDFGT